MQSLRSRVASWLGHRYLVRATNKGFDMSKMPFFPESALMPVRREGLDPVRALGERRRAEPVSKLVGRSA